MRCVHANQLQDRGLCLIQLDRPWYCTEGRISQGQGKLGMPSNEVMGGAALIGSICGGSVGGLPGAAIASAVAVSLSRQSIRPCHGCKGSTMRKGAQVSMLLSWVCAAHPQLTRAFVSLLAHEAHSLLPRSPASAIQLPCPQCKTTGVCESAAGTPGSCLLCLGEGVVPYATTPCPKCCGKGS